MANVRPIVQAFLLADRVYQDRATGKMVIAGTFNEIRASKFPFTFSQQASLFLSMIGVHGKGRFHIQLQRLAPSMTIRQMEFKVDSPSPLGRIELAIPVPELPFEHPGLYSFDLAMAQEPIASLRFFVGPMKENTAHG
jgi:hypothetical protein